MRTPAPAKNRSGQKSRAAQERAAMYRRRRATVAVISLLILAALVFAGIKAAPFVTDLLGSIGGPAQEEPTAPAPVEGTPDEEALANPVECLPDVVSIELDAASAPAGSEVPVNVTLTNDGQVPCLLDTGHSAVTMVVTSGNDTVWTSAQCPAGPAERPVLLDLGATETRQIVWSGARSSKGCPAGAPAAKAGTYQVDVAVTLTEGTVATEQVLVLR